MTSRSPVAECDESYTDLLVDYLENFTLSDDISLLLDEVRQNYNVHSQDVIQSQSDGTNTEGEEKANAAFEEALNKLHDTNVDRSKRCANCSEAIRVESVSSFRRGQHISIQGQCGQSYDKFTPTLEHCYKHHAIVKEIKRKSGTRVEMVLIHFSKENGNIEICQAEKTYDLKNDEIYIIQYLHPRYTTEEIARRAESMLPQNGDHAFKTYNAATKNCEHFATWCVVGEEESFQVQGLRHSIANGFKKLFDDRSRIAKEILRLLFVSSDKIAARFTKAVNVPVLMIVGPAAVYLINCIVTTALHVRDYRNGQMCWSCLKGKLQDLWFTFGAFGVTSAISFAIFYFALPLMAPPIGIPLAITLFLSVILPYSVSKIRKLLQNPFKVDKNDVKTLSDIKHGDVVSLRYYGLEHVMIVSEVQEENDSIGQIRGIHYGLPHLFGTREVMEEYFMVDLKKERVKLYDCRHLLCHSQESVVMRARKRVGETKWALASNRSGHLCFWAKVQRRPSGACEEWDNGSLAESESKTLSSLFIEEKDIHLANEMKVGDVIKYKRTGILVGIVQSTSQNGRHFEIEMVVYDSNWYCRYEKYRVDLNKDRLYVKKYHPAHCHPMAVRAERAKELKDKKGNWWTVKGFIEHCILLNS